MKHPDQEAFESMGEVWAESDRRLIARVAELEAAIREVIEDINEGCGTVHAIKRLRALTEGE